MDVRSAALSYLEHRMRTTSEMQRKLADKGFSGEEIRETMQWLRTAGYIDDVKYGAEYLRYAFDKGRGLARVKMELERRGLLSCDIESAIYAYEDEYEVDIMEEEEKRAMAQGEILVQKNGSDEKALAKMGRRLDALGYHSGLIRKVINRYR